LLIRTVPLWRDSDGFFQVSAKVGVLTLLHWPPLYCLTARIPLAVGAWLQGIPFAFGKPELCDSGVGLLLWTQHILLILAVAWLIACITRNTPVRWMLAGFFIALGSPLYVYAHSVGTESFSNTIQLALTANVILLLKSETNRRRVGYTLLLTLGILTRHINAVFAAVLPLAYLIRLLSGTSSKESDPIRRQLLRVALAVGCGMVALFGANLTVRMLCSVSKTPYHSRMGYVFQWRLGFVSCEPEAVRTGFFNAIVPALRSEESRSAMRAYEQEIASGSNPDTEFLGKDIRSRVEKKMFGKERRIEENRLLNEIAGTVIFKFPPAYRDVVVGDFQKMFGLSPVDIVMDAVGSTEWVHERLGEERFAALRPLATFRDGIPGRVDVFRQHPHINGLRPVSLLSLGIVAVLVWLATAFVGRESWQFVLPPALLLTGALLCFLNCMTTFFMARFGLPLYGSIVVALMVSVSFLAETVVDRWKSHPTDRSQGRKI
jgi:hypothetical protein